LNDKNFRLSGRNTIIHKNKKIDLILVNGDHPVIIISHTGIDLYKGVIPRKRIDAKRAHQELIDVSRPEVFGQEKTLVFVEALDNKEYKLDYSKINTASFIKVHQENYI
jgi:aspartyl aminopeptidase